MDYEKILINEIKAWKNDMEKGPKFTSIFSKKVQNKVNEIIPKEAHEIITAALKNMTKVLLKGSEIISGKPYHSLTIRERDYLFEQKKESYRKAATISGISIGAGGIMIGLTDLPVLLSIKIKFLYDTALIYGYDIKDFKERLFILYVFMLAFSCDEKRLEVYKIVKRFDKIKDKLPSSYEEFDWKSFQQEYRDYIDLAKLLQFLPIVGAVFGGVANYRLLNRLSYISKNAYRYRWLKSNGLL
ncbi:EcsC family protein [Clostridium sp.]|uniref:EcsC family protein n=1 Tax=Clostridium sp. TaxID=1506 RepID=UPI002FC8C53B